MSNVLSEEKKQQVIALGRLGWSLRRIQRATGVRRETAAAYLKAAGIAATGHRRWGPAATGKTGHEVITDSAAAKPALDSSGTGTRKTGHEVTTDFGAELAGANSTSGTAAGSQSIGQRLWAVPGHHRTGALAGRNARAIWQDLVDYLRFHRGYQSVKRFVASCAESHIPEACAVIETAPGEDYGESASW